MEIEAREARPDRRGPAGGMGHFSPLAALADIPLPTAAALWRAAPGRFRAALGENARDTSTEEASVTASTAAAQRFFIKTMSNLE